MFIVDFTVGFCVNLLTSILTTVLIWPFISLVAIFMLVVSITLSSSLILTSKSSPSISDLLLIIFY